MDISKLWGKIFGSRAPVNGIDYNDVIWLSEGFLKNGGPYAYYNSLKKKKLIVKVPAGIGNGQRIRLPGMGLPGKRGGKSGDLYLKVTIKKGFFARIKGFFSKK